MSRLRFLWRAAPVSVLLVLILAPVFIVTSQSQTPSDAQDRITANLLNGRPIQALYQVEAQAAAAGWTPALLRAAGNLWQDIGDLTLAVAYWEAAARGETDNVPLLRDLAAGYVTLQRWPEAVEALRQLSRLSPEELQPHYQLGLTLAAYNPQEAAVHLGAAARSPQYAETAGALLPILTDLSSDGTLFMRIGFALADRDLWPYAELAFEQAYIAGQALPESLAYAGLSRDRQGKDGGPLIEQAVRLGSDNPQVRYLEGLHLRGVGAYQKSRDALQLAVDLDPENPAYHTELGAAYRLLGELAQAEYWLRSAVRLSGDAPEFQALLALFYAEEAPNLTSSGLDVLEQMAEQQAGNLDVRASHGWALHTIGQTDAGLAELDAVLALAPDHARALFYKARILLEIDRLEEARPLLERVAGTSAPFAEEASRMLQSLGPGE